MWPIQLKQAHSPSACTAQFFVNLTKEGIKRCQQSTYMAPKALPIGTPTYRIVVCETHLS